MDTPIQKLDLIHWITELDDFSVLAQVKEIKDKTVVTSEDEWMSIEQGLTDFRHNKVHSHTQVKKRYEKWL